jgi:hypothetical protein
MVWVAALRRIRVEQTTPCYDPDQRVYLAMPVGFAP